MLEVIRYVVFGVFAASTAIAVGSWAVRTRRLNPFGRTARIVRKVSDPILSPVETWLVRRGGNPHGAEWWFAGGTLVGGIVFITLMDFVVRQVALLSGAAGVGPFAVIRVGVYYAGQIVSIAILIRVVGSWFGKDRHHPFMRPMYYLTDWIIQPLQRVVPPIGMIDITPLVAYFAVRIAVSLITGF